MRTQLQGCDPTPAMTNLAPAGDLDRADLFFCLARALLPPAPNVSVCDWAQPLADDLAELGHSLGIDTAPALLALDAECGRWAANKRQSDGRDADGWLVEYARLFLTPPVAVTLNTGIYLEGALGGASATAMVNCYRTAGFAPDEGFLDLPDHAAMQLEFVASLWERSAQGDASAEGMAEEFCCEFVHAWGGPLEQACVAAGEGLPAARVYAALVRLLRAAIDDPTLT